MKVGNKDRVSLAAHFNSLTAFVWIIPRLRSFFVSRGSQVQTKNNLHNTLDEILLPKIIAFNLIYFQNSQGRNYGSFPILTSCKTTSSSPITSPSNYPCILSSRSRHFNRLRIGFTLKIVKEEIGALFRFRLPGKRHRRRPYFIP